MSKRDTPEEKSSSPCEARTTAQITGSGQTAPTKRLYGCRHCVPCTSSDPDGLGSGHPEGAQADIQRVPAGGGAPSWGFVGDLGWYRIPGLER